MLKVMPDGAKHKKRKLINPERPIPPEVSLIHGITDEMVKDAPFFRDAANEIKQFLEGADLAGYNSNKFDWPLLMEEFLRAGLEFDIEGKKLLDVQKIYHLMEPRNLSAAYKFYCNQNLENAHSAEADTMATYEILKAQLDRYEDLENNMKTLAEYTTRKKAVDSAGFIALNNEGQEIFTFGKHKGALVDEVLDKEPGYFSWIQNAEFPLYTKKVLTGIKLRKLNTK
jgi:DNA polymerase-3 subunit epsilon